MPMRMNMQLLKFLIEIDFYLNSHGVSCSFIQKAVFCNAQRLLLTGIKAISLTL